MTKSSNNTAFFVVLAILIISVFLYYGGYIGQFSAVPPEDDIPFSSKGCFPNADFEGHPLEDWTDEGCFFVKSKDYLEGDGPEYVFSCTHNNGYDMNIREVHSCVNGLSSGEMQFGPNYVEVIGQRDNLDGTYGDDFGWIYTYAWANAYAKPCVMGPGEWLIFDTFGQNTDVSEEDLSYTPIKYCSLLQPLIYDKNLHYSYLEPEMLNKIRNGDSFFVGDNQEAIFYYVALQPPGIDVLCEYENGEVADISQEICIDAGGIIIPCHEGILNKDGTCVIQPELDDICDGQLSQDKDGNWICTQFAPIDQKYICIDKDGNEFEVETPDQCVGEDLELISKIYCNGKEVETVEECKEIQEIKSEVVCENPNLELEEIDGELKCIETGSVYSKESLTLLLTPFNITIILVVIGMGLVFLYFGRKK